jgi:phospholipase C
MQRKGLSSVTIAVCMALMLSSCGGSDNNSAGGGGATTPPPPPPAVSEQDALQTATPIKHLVVIFGENESFDHYFGTYPQAANPLGEPSFKAASGTPTVNGLTPALLTQNPNTKNAANLALTPSIAASLMNPFRLDRSQANTASQNHAYTPEQLAADNGKMDAFVANTGTATTGGAGAFGTKAQVMGYFDGNTVTALWNYAQNFAMSDNAFTDSFGPSTPGALNVVSGTTNGGSNATSSTVPDGQGGFTLINDSDPTGDVCSAASGTIQMSSKNIGDLLNAAKITWGGFMGGFNLSTTNVNGTSGCTRSSFSSVINATKADYIPHHAWFQYYASTLNAGHNRPSSTAMIGHTETFDTDATKAVHHQYDYDDFVAAVSSGNYPSVSYLKAPSIQDAHPGNSDPLDEQAFVTRVINFLQQQPDWSNTAVIIAYDDSDGWYDHQSPSILNASSDPTADQFTAPGSCTGPNAKPAVGVNGTPVNGRCGPGTRTPFILISPYAKPNYVDHTSISQASIVRFIEDNWLGGARLGGGSNDATAGSIMSLFDFTSGNRAKTLYLDPMQGTPVSSPPA